MEKLLREIRNCNVCEKHLEFGVNPIISLSKKSKIIIVGQAQQTFLKSLKMQS